MTQDECYLHGPSFLERVPVYNADTDQVAYWTTVCTACEEDLEPEENDRDAMVPTEKVE